MSPYQNIRAAQLALAELADTMADERVTDDQIRDLAAQCISLARECSTLAHLLLKQEDHAEKQAGAIGELQEQAARSWEMVQLLSEAVFGPAKGST